MYAGRMEHTKCARAQPLSIAMNIPAGDSNSNLTNMTNLTSQQV